MSKFVITYTPYFKKSMIRELVGIDKNLRVSKVLSNSALIVESELSREEFTERALEVSPIFVKHMMPIMKEGKISEDFDSDKAEILSGISELENLASGDPYAVQCRIIAGGKNGLDYSSKDIEVFVGTAYERLGCIPTFSDSELINEDVNIMSILINGDDYYLGYSTSRENLNFHCDEYRICSKKGREISRAENKLKEALVKFGIHLSGEGYALDIGAAPGGWTKVLADFGYNVIAVDPGALKPELYAHPRIKHHKCRIEDLKFSNFFDIIVNDMNVEPQVTAEIMNGLVDSLKDDGLAIVTLKLPDKVDEDIQAAKAILGERYDVLTTKSLFHNRQEVTTLVRKKTRVKADETTNAADKPKVFVNKK